jgi:DnaJ-domain-containing protein 1
VPAARTSEVAINPQLISQLVDEPEMHDVADDVTTKLQAAIESLSEPTMVR